MQTGGHLEVVYSTGDVCVYIYICTKILILEVIAMGLDRDAIDFVNIVLNSKVDTKLNSYLCTNCTSVVKLYTNIFAHAAFT